MLGYRFCLHQVGLAHWPLRIESRLGRKRSIEQESDQHRVHVYPELQALPTEGETAIFAHLEFALRHEGVDLAALAAICAGLDPQRLADWINGRPSGKYARKIGFLYEWLRGGQLPIDATLIAGAYEPVLDREVYFTGPVTNISRWHVRNNLPGVPEWCPTVHRETLGGLPVGTLDVAAELKTAHAQIPQELREEVDTHACFAEIHASYAIDEQTASPAQEDAFARMLRTASLVPVAERLRSERLIELQGALFSGTSGIVTYGPRRDDTFVGSTGRVGLKRVEYPCPPARAVEALLKGLQRSAAERLAEPPVSPVVFAGVVSFGFAFIHPLMEGNGRIHRFLVHAALGERGVSEPDTIIPVSAAMLARSGEYGHALRAYSAPVRATAEALAGVPYILEPTEPFTFRGYDRVAPLYRYPVLTDQVAYLEGALRQGIETGLMEEAHVAEHLAEVRTHLVGRLGVPTERVALLIRLIRRDGGILSNAERRAHFPDLSEEQLRQAQSTVATVLPPDQARQVREAQEETAQEHAAPKR